VLHRLENRSVGKVLKYIGRDGETKDGGKRAEDGENADLKEGAELAALSSHKRLNATHPEVVKSAQLLDLALLELLVRQRKELDIGRDLGRVDNSGERARRSASSYLTPATTNNARNAMGDTLEPQRPPN
jgi:hypothetical protein